MGETLYGAPVIEALTTEIRRGVTALKQQDIQPKLAILRIGEEGPDIAYEKGAVKTMETCGIATEVLIVPRDIQREAMKDKIEAINQNRDIHGLLILRPLPPQLEESVIKGYIAPEKDVDCFSPINTAKVFEGDNGGFLPCTPAAVLEMLKFYHIPINGQNVVIIGRSNVVGKPLAMMLLRENATVTLCHTKTRDIKSVCQRADMVIAAAGAPKMVTPEFIAEGAVVIDVGISFLEGLLCGDVAPEVVEKASKMTPVPGGVGGVTRIVLAKNLLTACRRQNNA